MSDLDVFRQDFAGILAGCARARRAALSGGMGNGDDLKIIALFERLALDAETLDPGVFARCRSPAEEGLDERCFMPRREALLAEVGILYWPKDAADLIGWMRAQATLDLSPARQTGRAGWPARDPSRSAGRDGRPSGPALRAWACDLSAGFGIVGPLLSLWTVHAGFAQRHDRAFIAEHPSVRASVVSVDAASAGKSSGATSDVVLVFQQPSGETCRVTWRTGLSSVAKAPGDSLIVVPRSSGCEMPLIPSEVGDPRRSFALAAALMAAGLACIVLWSRLFRHAPRARVARAWSSA